MLVLSDNKVKSKKKKMCWLHPKEGFKALFPMCALEVWLSTGLMIRLDYVSAVNASNAE